MLSDQRTYGQLRVQVRRELKDANEQLTNPHRWWTDAELNDSIESWMQDLNWQYYFCMTATTLAIGSATSTFTLPSSMHRVDRVLWNGQRLSPTTRLEIDSQHPEWATTPVQNKAVPTQVIQIDNRTLVLNPVPGLAGSAEVLGPTSLLVSGDSALCPLPSWAYFSVRLYCAYVAYMRAGPNQDLRKASRYKARYERAKKFFRLMQDARFAAYGPRLKPASSYEGAILNGGGR